MHKLSTGTSVSLHTSSEPSRFAQTLSRSARSLLVAGPKARAAALSKSKFTRLPQEPEDARITGLTRSLTRRLMGLNMAGTLKTRSLPTTTRIPAMSQAKIA